MAPPPWPHRKTDTLEFKGPLGSSFLREDSRKPIIFVAGATGFAPVKSMVEHAFHAGMKRRMFLYWGARRLRDLYLADLPRQWAREHDNFMFVPVLSGPAPEDNWSGRTGLVHEAILADFPDLSEHQVYACGSVAMVQTAHPAFVAHGMSEPDCFSDAFKVAPNMRAQTVCPRERADVTVELEMDGKLPHRIVAPPTGFGRDGASTVHRRVTVGAGRHEFRVRLSDNAQGEFNWNRAKPCAGSTQNKAFQG